MRTEDVWARIAAAKEIHDRAYGKAREHMMIEQQDTLVMEYPSLEELRAQLIADGIPIDRLEEPKLIDHERT